MIGDGCYRCNGTGQTMPMHGTGEVFNCECAAGIRRMTALIERGSITEQLRLLRSIDDSLKDIRKALARPTGRPSRARANANRRTR